jgi:hypothetical protein
LWEVIYAQALTTAVTTPATKGMGAVQPTPIKRRRRKKVAATKPAAGKVALLTQAEEVRLALRTTLGQVNDLIREVKSQRSKDKLIQTTMDSLRKLNLNIV